MGQTNRHQGSPKNVWVLFLKPLLQKKKKKEYLMEMNNFHDSQTYQSQVNYCYKHISPKEREVIIKSFPTKICSR